MQRSRIGRCSSVASNQLAETAAERWVAAVNAEGSQGRWAYRIARRPTEVSEVITTIAQSRVETQEALSGP